MPELDSFLPWGRRLRSGSDRDIERPGARGVGARRAGRDVHRVAEDAAGKIDGAFAQRGSAAHGRAGDVLTVPKTAIACFSNLVSFPPVIPKDEALRNPYPGRTPALPGSDLWQRDGVARNCALNV